MSAAVEKLLRHPSIWRAGAAPKPEAGHLSTGWAELDAALPGGGWPLGALTEILTVAPGVGELGMLLPALTRLVERQLWLAWVAPPMVPYAPALAAHGCDLSRVLSVTPRGKAEGETQALWAAEQLLHAKSTGAVLLWTQSNDERHLRRLQLAAEASGSLAVLFRSAQLASASSPAALRLLVNGASAVDRGPDVEVLKCRGRLPFQRLHVG